MDGEGNTLMGEGGDGAYGQGTGKGNNIWDLNKKYQI